MPRPEPAAEPDEPHHHQWKAHVDKDGARSTVTDPDGGYWNVQCSCGARSFRP